MVSENEENHKALQNSIHKENSPTLVLTDCIIITILANTFMIITLETKLLQVHPLTKAPLKINLSLLGLFQRRKFKSTPNKSRNLNLIPMSVVCDCISVLLIHITNILNSLQKDSFLFCFEIACVTFLLKKACLVGSTIT